MDQQHWGAAKALWMEQSLESQSETHWEPVMVTRSGPQRVTRQPPPGGGGPFVDPASSVSGR